jgi:nucleoside 2-deoxyribosyltransferase
MWELEEMMEIGYLYAMDKHFACLRQTHGTKNQGEDVAVGDVARQNFNCTCSDT